jgi:hypothetical protein
MQSESGPGGRPSLPIASQTSEPADDGPEKPSPVRQPFVGVRVFRVLLRELWTFCYRARFRANSLTESALHIETQCPSAPLTYPRFGDMDSNMRKRSGVGQNGTVTPPAPSSEAEDGYDTSTAMDSSKVCQFRSYASIRVCALPDLQS